MKNELLGDDDLFDTEVLQDNTQKQNTRLDYPKTEAYLKSKFGYETYTPEELTAVKKDLEGETQFQLMEIRPEMLKKVNFYKKMLLYVNCPLMVAIPTFIHTPLFSYYVAAEKAQAMMILMSCCDLMLVVDSYLIYAVVSKLATSVIYKPADDKLEITTMGGMFMSQKTQVFEPMDLQKHLKKSINPFVGYKTVTGVQVFGTEGIGQWADRKFLDSIVKEQKIRVLSPEQEKRKRDLLD